MKLLIYLSLICCIASAITAGVRILLPATFSLYTPVILIAVAFLFLVIASFQDQQTTP